VDNLPNIKSAEKRVRVTESKSMQNQVAKSALKTSIKKFETAIAAGDAAIAGAAYAEAVKKVDSASGKGILHKNTAARKKSSMTKKLNAVK
jgi:small subunit ribosomal protein S20